MHAPSALCPAQVRVKVTEVRDDGAGPPRINCSIKAVDQATGEDLDPSNALAGGGRGPGGGGGGGSARGPVSDAPPEARAGAAHTSAPVCCCP